MRLAVSCVRPMRRACSSWQPRSNSTPRSPNSATARWPWKRHPQLRRGVGGKTNSSAAVRMGMDYLIGLGHEFIILLVTEISTSLSVREKIDSFEAIASERGLSHCHIVDCGVRNAACPELAPTTR